MRYDAEQRDLPLDDRPWKKSDTAKLLNLYLAGVPVALVAVEMKHPVAVIDFQLERFDRNRNDRCENYRPKWRKSRQGRPWTRNEQLMDSRMRCNGVSVELRSKVLCRTVQETTNAQKTAPVG